MTGSHRAVFVSHASEDGEVAARICAALRAAGVEVWLDQSELHGGDAWDRQIRRHIHDCALFVALISAHTNARTEGYFRREWRLAVDRTHDMADDAAFLLPVVIDDTSDATARVPEPFREVQWTHLPAGEAPQHFVARVLALLATMEAEPAPPTRLPATAAHSTALPGADPAPLAKTVWWRSTAVPWLLAIAGLLAIGWLVLQRVPSTRRTAPNVPAPGAAVLPGPTAGSEQSIAVLPFLDLSEKHDQEYFSDGLTEELIDRLANLPGLHVPARTSSFHFKGQNATIPEIARTLGVAHVLEGSVRKSGETLRITAQLIRAVDGYHLWSSSYDRQLKDIFRVQDDIADQVVQALRVKLVGPLPRSEVRTQNVVAHNLLLQGNFYAERSGAGDFDRATSLYEAAIKEDPNFSRAWAGLGWALIWKYPPVSAERIDRTTQRAIELDPALADAWAIRGWSESLISYDWAQAAAAFDKALAMDPRNIRALHGKGQQARMLGKFDEAIRYYKEAQARDPVDPSVMDGLSHTLLCAGRGREAVDHYRRVLELSPDYSGGHSAMAWTLLNAGDAEAARREIVLEPFKSARLWGTALIEQALHHQNESDKALQELIAMGHMDDAYGIAGVYATRGDAATAVTWLDRGFKARAGSFSDVAVDPEFRRIHDDPRFKAFLSKIKLPA